MLSSPIHGKGKRYAKEKSYIMVRLLLVVSVLCLSALALLASPIPTGKPSNYPAWWFQRDVIARLSSTDSSPVWTNSYPPSDDYTAINEGQLKNFATQAYAELQGDLPTSVWSTTQGQALTTLIQSWSPTASGEDDYKAINLGQLKTVAKPFYDVLAQIGYTMPYPWTGTGAEDYAVANIGQLKNVFNFDLSLPGPSNLTAIASGSGTITLNWSLPPSNNATSLLVEKQNTDGSWSIIAPSIDPTTTSYSVTGLTNGQSYNFQVIATGSSSVSIPTSATATASNSMTTGLILWLKADAGVLDTSGNPAVNNSSVGTWTDQTGNTSATGTSGSQPTYATNDINGEPALRFDGSSAFLQVQSGLTNLSAGVSVFAVFKPASSASNYARIFDFGNGANSDNVLLCHDGGLSSMLFYDVTGTSVVSQIAGNNELETNAPQEYTAIQNGSTSMSMYRNGILVNQITSGVTALNNILRQSNFIGKSNWSTDPLFQGDIAEILIYNGPLSSDEQAQVEGYLADKYGLYNPNATWFNATPYLAIKSEIILHQWGKTQANTYLAFLAAYSGSGTPTPSTAGLSLWLVASDAKTSANATPSNGDSVQTLVDRTGAHTLTNLNTGGQPTYVASDLNSQPGLHFNGGQWLVSADNMGAGLNGDMTIITVGENEGFSSSHNQNFALYLGQNIAPYVNRDYCYADFGPGAKETFDTQNAAAQGGSIPSTGTFVSEVVTLDSTLTSNNVAFYQNGIQMPLGGLSGQQNLSPGIMMGNVPNTGGGFGWNGDIVEQLVYDHKLSSAELQQVGLYLANKYNLPYPAAPTITSAPISGSSSLTISMSSPLTANATIYYTLDGTPPTTSSPEYTASFTLSSSALVQAILVLNGTQTTAPASAQYYINDSGHTGLAPAPTSLTATSGDDGIDLAWTLPSQVTFSALYVYRSVDGGSYQLIGTLGATATSFTDADVTSDHTYTYEVGTVNASGVSDTSASTGVTPSAPTPLTINVTTPSNAIYPYTLP